MDLQTFLTVIDFTGVSNGQDSVPPTIPAAPTTLVATADSDSIVLTWTRVGTYDNVLIDRKDTGSYSQLASIPTAATYDDTTAVVGVTYTYRVRGQRNSYASPYSNESSATIVESPSSITNSVAFPGSPSTAFLTAADTGLTVGQSYTLAFWIRPTNLSGMSAQGLLSRGNLDLDETMGWGCLVNVSSDALEYYVGDGGTPVVVVASAPGSLVANTWYFVTITFTFATSTVSLSLNRGTPVTSSDFFETAGIGKFKVGSPFGTGQVPFIGQISTIGVWQRVLTGSELDSLYNSGLGKTYEDLTVGEAVDLAAYWNMTEFSAGSVPVTRVASFYNGTAGEVDLEDTTTPLASSTTVPS